MTRRKPTAHVGTSKENRNYLRRSPRFEKQIDVSLLPEIFKNPNLKSVSVSRRSPRIAKLNDTNSVPNPKTSNSVSVRNQARLMSPSSNGRVMVNEGTDEVKKNVDVSESVVSVLRRSPRFGESCVEPIMDPKPGAFDKKSSAEVKGVKKDTKKERVCIRKSSRLSNLQRNYKNADQELHSTVNEISSNNVCKSIPSVKKNIKSNSPIVSDKEMPHIGKESSLKNEGKEAESMKRKRKRTKECSEAVVQGWTKEQEMTLKRAYMTMKPTPRFWKKVSKMVGKSAQECFDRINYDAHTPVPPRIRSRLKKKMSPLISEFSMSASKLLESPSRKPTRKRKTQLGHKKVRELLHKQCNVEKDYEGDLFSVLEGSSPFKVSQKVPAPSTPPSMPLRNERNSSSARKKCVSRLGKAALLVSPPVLKHVKNKVLHEKYIDRLHIREAKRKAELTRAKKTTLGKENLAPVSCNQISNEIKAAKDALELDVRDVILQFQQVQAKALNNSPSESEDDILLSSDEIEDEL